MLTSYRRILAEPGALPMSSAALVARLPISMVGLGIVLLVSAATGRYGVAGAVSAAYMFANAGFAILQGRLLDRLGQGRVLAVASIAFGLAVAMLVVSVQADWPIITSYVFAAVGGAFLPQVGSAVRTRWSHVLSQPSDVQTAFALEAVLDEAVFILGPILVAVLATTWHPVAGILVAIVACVLGTLWFSSQTRTAPPPHPRTTSTGPRPAMPWRAVVPLAVVGAALGVLFGAAEVTTVAFAEEHHHRSLSGLLLALWAAGSLSAGVITGAIHWRRGPATRVRWGSFAMACAMVPLYFVHALPLMGLVLFVAGFAIAPTMIATMSLTEAVVPAARLTEGMAIMQTGLVAGVAPGATLSGLVVDHQGASAAYLVSVAAGLVAALAAQALPPPPERRRRVYDHAVTAVSDVSAATEWRNWSGIESAAPARVEEPADPAAVVAAVERARSEGTTLKMVGTGHSFTAISAPEHTMLRPGGLQGIVGVDRDAMTVTALAGTQLKDLNSGLEALGLSLHNMGDIAEQTLAGATSTGTHGTGGLWASLSAQIAGFELVTGTGEVLRATADENPEVLDLGRVGLGALGVLTSITFRVEPTFVLEATETPMGWDEAIDGFDQRIAEHHHVDTYWFPHTDRLMCKTNDRLDVPVEEAEPLGRVRGWWEDEFLSNTAFGAAHRITNRFPGTVRRFNQLSSRLLSARTYSDVAHKVFISPRTVVFREMEYAVPREAGLAALAEARAALEASDLDITFPVEIRVTPADDIPLSTSTGRESIYLAFHTHRDVDHLAYFALLEPIMRAHDGRPHWGKVHTRTAADLAPAYPRFEEFLALRDRLDPDRVFANPYLRRVLGD